MVQQKQKKQQQPLKNVKKTLEERLARNLVNGPNGPIRINHYNPWTQQNIREGIGKEDPVSFFYIGSEFVDPREDNNATVRKNSPIYRTDW